MEKSFWLHMWDTNNIAFHEPAANPLLVEFFHHLSVPQGGRIFVPLCGKTLDIHWLLSQGHRVVGVELSTLAVEQLFAELDLVPEITVFEDVSRYTAANIDVFLGDIFRLTPDLLGPVDAIYDRAALVALPQSLREAYPPHLILLTGCAPQLLITFVYDQRLLDPPPFSIDAETVRRYYTERYDLEQLATVPVPGGLKGKCAADQDVWALRPKGRRDI
jgi:thiopurine S-methyltransferase